ncbi:MAG TPA: glycosyltransferase family 2 protein [Pyrinomonadaceae bacterium]|nr:glycosyltransferase family 2 protein [Pyrinomonadaceae bacterium]
MKISATIITLNEAANIGAACESLRWADEIVVVDSGSRDNTREIAAASGARVLQRDWPGFGAQKQFAVEQTLYEWVFSLDADERVSNELQTSIANLRDAPEDNLADGYRIARRSFYQGRWIKGGGWYPDWQLRLFRKSRGHWEPRQIHESVKMDAGARIEKLAGDILHYSVRDSAHHHRMIGDRYAPLAAQQMFDEGRNTSPLRIASAAPTAFFSSYVLKGGFRDGLAGLTIASFAAHHAFLKHLMLWEKRKAEKSEQ